ncbi:hypothetical protein T484DRAFT_1847443, partial [Baffinella frigidus]
MVVASLVTGEAVEYQDAHAVWRAARFVYVDGDSSDDERAQVGDVGPVRAACDVIAAAPPVYFLPGGVADAARDAAPDDRPFMPPPARTLLLLRRVMDALVFLNIPSELDASSDASLQGLCKCLVRLGFIQAADGKLSHAPPPFAGGAISGDDDGGADAAAADAAEARALARRPQKRPPKRKMVVQLFVRLETAMASLGRPCTLDSTRGVSNKRMSEFMVEAGLFRDETLFDWKLCSQAPNTYNAKMCTNGSAEKRKNHYHNLRVMELSVRRLEAEVVAEDAISIGNQEWALREAVLAGVPVDAFRVRDADGADTGRFNLAGLTAAIHASANWRPRAALPADILRLIHKPPGAATVGVDGKPVTLTDAQREELVAGHDKRQREVSVGFNSSEMSATSVSCGCCGLLGINYKGVTRNRFVAPSSSGDLENDDRVRRAAGGLLCPQCNVDITYTNENKAGFGLLGVPQCLKDLNAIEGAFVAKYATVFNVVRLTKSNTYKRKGNVICFQQTPAVDLRKAVELPRLASETQFVFVTHNEDVIRDFAGVHELRRDQIRNALNWLIQHHPGYNDGSVVLSEARFNLIPPNADSNVEGSRNGTFADASRNEVAFRLANGMEAVDPCVLLVSDKEPLPSGNEKRMQEDEVQRNLDELGDLGPQPAALGEQHGVDSGEAGGGGVGDRADRRTLGLLEFHDVHEGDQELCGSAFEQAVTSLKGMVEDASNNGANALEPVEAARKKAAADHLVQALTGATHDQRRPGSRPEGPVHMPLLQENRVSEYTPGLLSGAFPTLFPYGADSGDITCDVQRLKSIDIGGNRTGALLTWAHRLMWAPDGRFAKHPFFALYLSNVIHRRQAMGAVSVYSKKRLKDSDLTATDLHANKDVKGSDSYFSQVRKTAESIVSFEAWKNDSWPAIFI